MGQRERKRRKTSVTETAASDPAPGADRASRQLGPGGSGYERGRAKNDAIRAGLPPLAPGERPGAVTVAAVVAVLLAITVVVGAATDHNLAKNGGSTGGAILIAGLLLVAAVGMWRARYWAVLGFEALLGFQILVTALALTVASNWWAALLCVTVIGLSGWLFWKLIRAMARLQMPERGGWGSSP